MKKEEEILKYVKKRSLFDAGSDEFGRRPMEQKIAILRELNQYGYLEKTVRDYQKYYRDKQYLLDELPRTLQLLIEQLKYGKRSYDRSLEEKSVNELVAVLKTELTP